MLADHGPVALPSINNSNSISNQNNHFELLIRNNLQPLRIYADNQDKNTLCIFWSILFVVIIALIALGTYVTPQVYVKMNNLQQLIGTDIQNCTNPSSLINNEIKCGTFTLDLTLGQYVNEWRDVNQFGLVNLQIYPKKVQVSMQIKQQFTFQIYSILPNYNQTNQQTFLQVIDRTSTQQSFIDFSSTDAAYLYASDGITKTGYSTQLMVVSQTINHPFLMRVIFTKPLNMSAISSINLQSFCINPRYTYYTIGVRYTLLTLSIISCLLYLFRYSKILKDQTIEQKFIAVGSVLLVMFNDPFYSVTILKPNGAIAFLSIVYIANFITFLFLFWLVTADRINQQDGMVQTQLTPKKIATAAVIWAELIVCLMVYTMHQINVSPILTKQFVDSFLAARIIIPATMVGPIIYVFYQYVYSCRQDKLWRSQILMTISTIFIITIFVSVASNKLTPYNYQGSSIIIVYGLINTYFYYLQYMFTVTLDQIPQITVVGAQVMHNIDELISNDSNNGVEIYIEDDMSTRKEDMAEGNMNDSECIIKENQSNKIMSIQ